MASNGKSKKNTFGSTPGASAKKRVSQTELPSVELAQALEIPRAIWDDYAGDATAPHDVAIAMEVSPTSSAWRVLTGAAVAYGLTSGGYNADRIELTDLGRQFVAPKEEGEDTRALTTAALKPRIPAEFYKKYDRAKWPKDQIAANVLINMGVTKEKAAEAAKLVRANAEFVGFVKDTKTGPFISLDSPTLGGNGPAKPGEENTDSENENDPQEENAGNALATAGYKKHGDIPPVKPADRVNGNNRVFITHGKDLSTMEQIKQVVELGGFDPVVSVQRETAAKAVPDKVMDDMRSCGAAIIHASGETTITDSEGVTHTQLNPNVLIEIGAAMALYKNRFILVVENGVELPSNLQGLYQSRYSGKELSFEAGMKILKALRGLKQADLSD